MKITLTWSITPRKLSETRSRPLKTSDNWIRRMLVMIVVLICLNLQAAAASDDIDAQIRAKQKLLEELAKDYKFYKLFETPGTWAIPVVDVVMPVPNNVIDRAYRAHYLKEIYEGKITVEESEKKVATLIRGIEQFDRAFKAQLREEVARIKRQQDGLRVEIAALEKRKALPQEAKPPGGAVATGSGEISKGQILDTAKWTKIVLREYGFEGEFKKEIEGEDVVWKGSWPGGCQSTTFRLETEKTTTIGERETDKFDIVLKREDGDKAECSFSPNLRAEYHLLVIGSTLRGKRIVTDPGTLDSMAWLKGNIVDVTGSAGEQ